MIRDWALKRVLSFLHCWQLQVGSTEKLLPGVTSPSKNRTKFLRLCCLLRLLFLLFQANLPHSLKAFWTGSFSPPTIGPPPWHLAPNNLQQSSSFLANRSLIQPQPIQPIHSNSSNLRHPKTAKRLWVVSLPFDPVRVLGPWKDSKNALKAKINSLFFVDPLWGTTGITSFESKLLHQNFSTKHMPQWSSRLGQNIWKGQRRITVTSHPGMVSRTLAVHRKRMLLPRIETGNGELCHLPSAWRVETHDVSLGLLRSMVRKWVGFTHV